MPAEPVLPSTARLDPALCPLCGKGNQCAMEAERETGIKQPPCWCTQVDFNREAVQRIPEARRGQACICPACGTRTPTYE